MIKKLLTFQFLKDRGTDGKTIRFFSSLFFYCIIFILFWSSWGIMDETQRGVRVTFGKMSKDIEQPGIYVKLPFVTTMNKYSVMVIKQDTKMEAFTKDIQTAELSISISYQLDRETLTNVYSTYGRAWEDKIIWNNLSQVVKDAIGKYNAENLVESRDVVAAEILNSFNDRIKDLPATITQFQLLDIGYSDVFESAIEKKVVAAQAAKEAENKTRQIEEEAKQTVLTAKAEAEAMRIKANALSQNKALVEYEAIMKWNGILPTTTLGNNVPFINLK